MSILEDIQKARNLALVLTGKAMIYAVSEALPQGKVIRIAETDLNYAFALFASEHEAQQVAAQLGIGLVHIKDTPMKPWP